MNALDWFTIQDVRRVIVQSVQARGAAHVTRHMIRYLFPGEAGAYDPLVLAAFAFANHDPPATGEQQLARFCTQHGLRTQTDPTDQSVWFYPLD